MMIDDDTHLGRSTFYMLYVACILHALCHLAAASSGPYGMMRDKLQIFHAGGLLHLPIQNPLVAAVG